MACQGPRAEDVGDMVVVVLWWKQQSFESSVAAIDSSKKNSSVPTRIALMGWYPWAEHVPARIGAATHMVYIPKNVPMCQHE